MIFWDLRSGRTKHTCTRIRGSQIPTIFWGTPRGDERFTPNSPHSVRLVYKIRDSLDSSKLGKPGTPSKNHQQKPSWPPSPKTLQKRSQNGPIPPKTLQTRCQNAPKTVQNPQISGWPSAAHLFGRDWTVVGPFWERFGGGWPGFV